MKINFFFLFVSIFLSLLAFTHAQGENHTYDVRKNKIEKNSIRYATWDIKPLVKVCMFAPVTKEEVKEALAWWEERGYEFEGVIYDAFCYTNVLPGHIIIDVHNQLSYRYNPDNLGNTFTVYGEETKEIRSASIYLGETRSRVLVHELGHALGWNHVNRIGHIMNPQWARGGWKDDFLRIKVVP
tara:strand:+ start:8596 stop:9147 length:552 start_codon:yes stop_codon:yes gene_type:complete